MNLKIELIIYLFIEIKKGNVISNTKITPVTKKNKLLNIPGQKVCPYFDPIILAAVSPTPMANKPENKEIPPKTAESVISQGEGWSHNGKEQPTKR